MMTDLDLDSKAILNGLVYLDQHNLLPPSAAGALVGQKQQQQQQQQKLSSAAAKGDDASSASTAGSATPAMASNKALGTQQTTAAGRPSASASSNAPVLTPQQQQQLLPGMSPKTAAGHFMGAGPHAIATLKVETSAVLKELARFRACDDQTMSCFYCREWAQWVYRKQISPQAAATGVTTGGSGGSGAGSASGGRKKKKQQGGGNAYIAAPVGSMAGGSGGSTEEAVADRERMERKRAARLRYNTIGDLCQSLRSMVASERDWILSSSSSADASAAVSRPSSPSPSVSSATSSNVTEQGGKQARGKATATGASARSKQGADDAGGDSAKSAGVNAVAALASSSIAAGNSQLIDHIVEEVSLWCEGYQFPLADVYEDLTFDFPPDAFPYDDNQDPLDPALLLPALQVTKSFISLPASNFPLLGNITSELIATHTYPTCQHTKADHPTPSELETQRLIFNSQLQKWRGEYKRSFEREMEPVWQITQLLLKSAQRIEAMRVRLFARGCRANREQFLQTIRNRTQPFAEYWTRASEAYRTGKAATMSGPPATGADDNGETDGALGSTPAPTTTSPYTTISPTTGKRVRSKRGVGHSSNVKSQAQLAEELDGIMFLHLDNLLEVSATWSRTFLESYYGVAREFARELETILGECITMCDRRAQGLKYPPPLTLQPQLEKARSAISCLLPHLESRIERIQEIVRERTAEIYSGTEDVRSSWVEGSGTTVQAKLAKAAHKDFRKKLRRIEHQQQTGIIGWAMRELEHLLTAPDVASVVADCLELLMTEAEILERAVGQVFVRKLEPTTEDLREQRQDIIDDFTEGLLTGREELAGIIGKLMLKEAWRILEANISLQRQKALLDSTSASNSSSSKKKNKAVQNQQPNVPTEPALSGSAPSASSEQPPPVSSVVDDDDFLNDDSESMSAKKRKRTRRKRNRKRKNTKQVSPLAMAEASIAEDEYDLDDDDDDDEDGAQSRGLDSAAMPDPQNPFASLALADSAHESRAAASSEASAQKERAAENAPPVVSASVVAESEVKVKTPAKSTGTSVAPTTVKAESKKAEPPTSITQQQQQQQQPPPAAVPTSAPATAASSASDPAAKPPVAISDEPAKSSASAASRSRRNTNAARYVPGVGFVSDDGTNATSPQLITPSNAVSSGASGYKSAANGVSPSGVLRSSAASNSERMSPMGAAARLASPVSRSASPMASLGTDRRVGSAASLTTSILDKEALAALETTLMTVPADQLEKKLGALAYENLVAITTNALVQRRRIEEYSVKLYDSVTGVVNTYNELQKQVESFKLLFVEGNGEETRLSALLAQAAQEAQSWHDRCDKLTAEVEALRLENKAKENSATTEMAHAKNTEDDGGSQKTGQRRPEEGMPMLTSGAGSENVWAINDNLRQQQILMPIEAQNWLAFNQQPMGFNNSLFGQFPGPVPPHTIAPTSANVASSGIGGLPASFTTAASLAHAQQQVASSGLDTASLMMFAANSQGLSHQQAAAHHQLAALMSMGIGGPGLSSAVHQHQHFSAASGAYDTATVSSLAAAGGGGDAESAAANNPTSASLLTTLNARSQQS